AFFRSGMIEAWGRGIERIMGSCKVAKVDVPEFRQEKTGLWVEFSFSHEKLSKNKSTTQKTTQKKIVDLIKNNPKITRKELANVLGISSNGVKYHLKKLKNAKIIQHVGSVRAGHWEVLNNK
ncbi:winged helix-turn-helix transcriptional regulator, partial [bacterium]|nr:winged helix-turn-helix transcriptional regulator [bacterium]